MYALHTCALFAAGCLLCSRSLFPRSRSRRCTPLRCPPLRLPLPVPEAGSGGALAQMNGTLQDSYGAQTYAGLVLKRLDVFFATITCELAVIWYAYWLIPFLSDSW